MRIDSVCLNLLHPDGTRSIALLSVSEDEDESCLIDYDHSDHGGRQFKGDDFFWALKELRHMLDPLGIKALCNGARVDAVCSGMASQMGLGLKIYLVEIGRPATMDDLVNTFDETAPQFIGTVEEQGNYQNRWIESLKSR